VDLDAALFVGVEGVVADGEDGRVDGGRGGGGELEADEPVVDAGREVGVGGQAGWGDVGGGDAELDAHMT
jgi:hypothetical protein